MVKIIHVIPRIHHFVNEPNYPPGSNSDGGAATTVAAEDRPVASILIVSPLGNLSNAGAVTPMLQNQVAGIRD